MRKMLRAGLYLCALLTFFLTMEFCARLNDWVSYGAPLWQNYNPDRLRGADAEGMQINLPRASFEKWRHNSLGFRSAEVSRAKAPGRVRVVCLGASETYGYAESPGKEWPEQLKSKLPARFEVLNASVVGMSLKHYRAYCEKYVLPVHPDLVICYVNPFFYASSFEHERHEQKIHPGQIQKVRQSSPAQGPQLPEKLSLKALARRIFDESRVIPKIKLVVKDAVQKSFPDLLQRYQIAVTRKQIMAAEAEGLGGERPKDTVSPACAREYRRELGEIVDFLQAHGVRTMLCSYPSLITCRNYRDRFPVMFVNARRFCVELSFDGMIDALATLNGVTRSVAMEKGALFADCHGAMPDGADYFVDNVHYTDRGAKVVANTVAASIENELLRHTLR